MTEIPDPGLVVFIALVFLIAGAVKGVIGLGLPTVSLGLLVIVLDLPIAMGLLLVPSVVTNLWQASVGGYARMLLVRLWPFFLAATATVWMGALLLVRVDLSVLSFALGIVMVIYALLSLSHTELVFSAGKEKIAGVMFGTVNGILTGMTGSFVVPGVLYLQATGLSRDMLIQAMGILFTLLTLALAFALRSNKMLDGDQMIASSLAMLPACLGMVCGQAIRRRIPERSFRRIFFLSLLVLGTCIAVSALMGIGN